MGTTMICFCSIWFFSIFANNNSMSSDCRNAPTTINLLPPSTENTNGSVLIAFKQMLSLFQFKQPVLFNGHDKAVIDGAPYNRRHKQ
jgi:hypothetical protein